MRYVFNRVRKALGRDLTPQKVQARTAEFRRSLRTVPTPIHAHRVVHQFPRASTPDPWNQWLESRFLRGRSPGGEA